MQHPLRVAPVVGSDINSKLGLDGRRPNRGVLWSLAAGGFANAAGEHVVAMLLRHELCAASTFWSAVDTHSNGRGTASVVDFVLLPHALRPRAESCRVWRRTGRAIQASP